MPDMIRQVDYYYTMAPDKAGEGARLLAVLRNAGVNLLAFSAFPSARKSQADFVPADGAAFVAAAKQAKIKLKGPKKCFLIEGDDRVGALGAGGRSVGLGGLGPRAAPAASLGGRGEHHAKGEHHTQEGDRTAGATEHCGLL